MRFPSHSAASNPTKRRQLKLAKSNVESFYDLDLSLPYSQIVSPKALEKGGGDYSTSTVISMITVSVVAPSTAFVSTLIIHSVLLVIDFHDVGEDGGVQED